MECAPTWLPQIGNILHVRSTLGGLENPPSQKLTKNAEINARTGSETNILVHASCFYSPQ